MDHFEIRFAFKPSYVLLGQVVKAFVEVLVKSSLDFSQAGLEVAERGDLLELACESVELLGMSSQLGFNSAEPGKCLLGQIELVHCVSK